MPERKKMKSKVLNPVATTYCTLPPPPQLSLRTFHIAGILTTIYGLDELPPKATETACLWLLHPRLQTHACMQPFAASAISNWNERIRTGQTGAPQQPAKGLIAVSFDLRNHGSREVDKLANKGWRGGNPRAAQDMFSQMHGNAADMSILLDYLPAYAFPDDSVEMTQNLVLGISLGGLAAWQVLLRDPRITTGIVGLACPDFARFMLDRARMCKIKDWDPNDPYRLFGSGSFSPSLCSAVEKYDPAGLIMGILDGKTVNDYLHDPSDHEKARISAILDQSLRGKHILLLSGKADRLIPHKCSEPFLIFLKRAISTYYRHGGIELEDRVFDGVGHEFSPNMVEELIRFMDESMGADTGKPKQTNGIRRESKL